MLAYLAVATAVMLTAMMLLAATAVVVKSVIVVEWMAVPLAIDTPLVLMELDTVGIAVPVAIFQVLKVSVPASTRMFHALKVQANGTVTYCVVVVPDVSAEPAGSPKVNEMARMFGTVAQVGPEAVSAVSNCPAEHAAIPAALLLTRTLGPILTCAAKGKHNANHAINHLISYLIKTAYKSCHA
jgi:hypothetical protein